MRWRTLFYHCTTYVVRRVMCWVCFQYCHMHMLVFTFMTVMPRSHFCSNVVLALRYWHSRRATLGRGLAHTNKGRAAAKPKAKNNTAASTQVVKVDNTGNFKLTTGNSMEASIGAVMQSTLNEALNNIVKELFGQKDLNCGEVVDERQVVRRSACGEKVR